MDAALIIVSTGHVDHGLVILRYEERERLGATEVPHGVRIGLGDGFDSVLRHRAGPWPLVSGPTVRTPRRVRC